MTNEAGKSAERSVRRWTSGRGYDGETRLSDEIEDAPKNVEFVEASAYDREHEIAIEMDAKYWAEFNRHEETKKNLDALRERMVFLFDENHMTRLFDDRDKKLFDARQELARLRASEERLLNALRFYADTKNWTSRTSGHGDSSTDVIKDDGGWSDCAGKIAREALADYEKSKSK